MEGSFLADPGQTVEISGVRFRLDLDGKCIRVTPLPPYGRIVAKRISGALMDRVGDALAENSLATGEPQD